MQLTILVERRWLFIATVVFLAAVLPAILYLWLRPPDLRADAKRALRALAMGDAEMLAAMVSEAELEVQNLTRHRAEQIIREFVLPAYTELRLSGATRTQDASEGESAIATASLFDASGRSYPIVVQVHAGENRTELSISQLLISAWDLERRRSGAGRAEKVDFRKGIALRVRRDLPRLKSLGVHYRFYPDREPITWEEYARRYETQPVKIESPPMQVGVTR